MCLTLVALCFYMTTLDRSENKKEANHARKVIYIHQQVKIPKAVSFPSINDKILTSLVVKLTEIDVKDTTFRNSFYSLQISPYCHIEVCHFPSTFPASFQPVPSIREAVPFEITNFLKLKI